MKLNTRDIQYITLFENMTGATVIDFLEAEGSLNYLVKEGMVGLAIGKNGSNINKVKRALSSRVLVFEDSEDKERLVRNVCSPLSVRPSFNCDSIRIEAARKDREVINGKHMRLAKELLKRRLDVNKVDFVFS